jgi:hypothetical protein
MVVSCAAGMVAPMYKYGIDNRHCVRITLSLMKILYHRLTKRISSVSCLNEPVHFADRLNTLPSHCLYPTQMGESCQHERIRLLPEME